MPSPIEDRRPPITPQLAMRVAVLGGLTFVLFAVIFFRLWFLQVLTGDDYVSQARENRVRKVKIEAPRGNIIDRDGRTLVKTRAAPVVQILPNSVPEAELAAAESYRKLLSESEGRRPAAGCTPTGAVRRRLRSAAAAPWSVAPRAPSGSASGRSRPASPSCARSMSAWAR